MAASKLSTYTQAAIVLRPYHMQPVNDRSWVRQITSFRSYHSLEVFYPSFAVSYKPKVCTHTH